MGKIAGSEIDGIQGDQEVDGIFLIAEVMTVGIKLGCNYFTLYPNPGSLICDHTAAAAYAVKYIHPYPGVRNTSDPPPVLLLHL